MIQNCCLQFARAPTDTPPHWHPGGRSLHTVCARGSLTSASHRLAPLSIQWRQQCSGDLGRSLPVPGAAPAAPRKPVANPRQSRGAARRRQHEATAVLRADAPLPPQVLPTHATSGRVRAEWCQMTGRAQRPCAEKIPPPGAGQHARAPIPGACGQPAAEGLRLQPSCTAPAPHEPGPDHPAACPGATAPRSNPALNRRFPSGAARPPL
mmetsp:Transcript_45158/g.130769  ORF Transcript_45158/g.130769 Transcript_45158/m.130769 type:complete len:209 (-) Transcript_45158:367-993(-)